MSDTPVVWEHNDEDGDSCEIRRRVDPGQWQFSVTQGVFSGYPAVNLDREAMLTLAHKLIQELDIKRITPGGNLIVGNKETGQLESFSAGSRQDRPSAGEEGWMLGGRRDEQMAPYDPALAERQAQAHQNRQGK